MLNDQGDVTCDICLRTFTETEWEDRQELTDDLSSYWKAILQTQPGPPTQHLDAITHKECAL